MALARPLTGAAAVGFLLLAMACGGAPTPSNDAAGATPEPAGSAAPETGGNMGSDVGTVDGTTHAADSGAPPPPPSPCDRSKPFGGEVKVLSQANNPMYTRATFSPDGLHVYAPQYDPFMGHMVFQIYQASRPDASSAFGAFELVLPVSNDCKRLGVETLCGPCENIEPSVTADGLALYFVRNVTRWCTASDPQFSDMAIATRTNPSEPFGQPKSLFTLGAHGARISTAAPFVTPDNSALYYAITEPYDPGAPPPPARIGRVDTAGVVATFPELAAAQHRFWPVVSGDELEIFFTESDAPWSSSHKVLTAKRASRTDPFGTPTIAPNSDDVRFVNYLTPDACTIYYTRGSDVFSATREK